MLYPTELRARRDGVYRLPPPGARRSRASKFPWRRLSLLAIAVAAWPGAGSAAERITIVGSSTVYPFSVVVAEHFAKSGPFPEPEVRSTSTAEGFRLFCAGVATDTPDISNASRPMSQGEKAECSHNGVQNVAEIRIGYDSLILANTLRAPTFSISLEQLWRAVAQSVPQAGRLIANPYRSWRDIDPALPDRPIQLIGPAAGHGTRDAFVELVMEPGCRSALLGSAVALQDQDRACARIRTDGHWTDVEDMELILGKLASNTDAMGVLTFSYLEEFGNRIHAASINGSVPSRATIPTGSYPLARPLFIYVKEAHLATTTGLADYAAEFLSLCAAGAHGYLPDEGLVPLTMPELRQQRAAVARLQR
jgi:phosphate transport system substrate-binding protein